ncbi:MAG: acyltransferase [Gemmatimonadetes bacterium]|nr:acyltransferase [Gemmatimonadota bacterium]
MGRDAPERGYLPYIDGLRGVAVLAVVAYHLGVVWLPGGFTGVDIFFVISGFVVSASADRLERTTPLASMLRFYARRVRRIVPALVVCLLVTGVAGGLFIPAAWLSQTILNTGQAAFAGVSNWVIAATGGDYFSPAAEFNPYVHTWSLGVEEQFYLIFPVLLLPWSLGGRKRWASVALFGLGGAASLVVASGLLEDAGRDAEAFYRTTSRFWQLAAGVLLYQVIRLTGLSLGTRSHAGVWALARSAGIGVSAGLVLLGLLFARPGGTPWPHGLLPVLGTVGLLGLVYVGGRDGWVARTLSLPPVVGTGRISYSLYLWHWPVFVLFRWTTGLDTTLARVAAVSLALLLALLSYHLVEGPLRHAPSLVRMPDRRFLAAAVLVILSLGVAYRGTSWLRGGYSLSVVTRNATDWYPYLGVIDPSLPGCAVDTRRSNSTTVLSRVACDRPPTDGRRLFVAGDSHAAVYSEMLRRVVLQSGREVTLLSVTECPEPGPGSPERDCQSYVEYALAEIAAGGGAGDVLFLPRLRLARLTEQWALFDDATAESAVFDSAAQSVRARGETLALAALSPLAERGVRIIFEAPKPLFRAPAFRCSDWFNRGNPICERGLSIERDFLLRYRAPVMESLERLAAQLPGASVWDPFPVLCPGAHCAAASGGRPLFFDGDHLSGYGNRVLVPSFLAHVDGL